MRNFSSALFSLLIYIDKKSVSRCRNTPSSSTAKNLHRKCHKQATHPLYRIDIFSMSAMLITLLHSFLRFSGFDERRKSHNAQIGVLPQSECKITKFSSNLFYVSYYIILILNLTICIITGRWNYRASAALHDYYNDADNEPHNLLSFVINVSSTNYNYL